MEEDAGGGHGELPDLCPTLPSRRPGLVFFSSQVLQLSLLLADPVPWLPWLASPRLSPWLPSRMALEVLNDLFRLMSASSSCYFLSLCARFYVLPCQALHLPCVQAEAWQRWRRWAGARWWWRGTPWYEHRRLRNEAEDYMMIIGFDISTHLICIPPTVVRIFVSVWILGLSYFNFVNDTINFLDIASYFNCNNCAQRQISMCVSHRGKWVGWPV